MRKEHEIRDAEMGAVPDEDHIPGSQAVTVGTSPKAVAAGAGGAAIGAPLSAIIVWILQTKLHADMPDEVVAAVSALITAGVSFLAARQAHPAPKSGYIQTDLGPHLADLPDAE